MEEFALAVDMKNLRGSLAVYLVKYILLCKQKRGLTSTTDEEF